MRTVWLQMRMALVVAALFAIIYAFLSLIAYAAGLGTPIVFAILASVLVGFQFLIGPKIVEWSMRVRYVDEMEAPRLHRLIERLARDAGIPKPRVGIAEVPIPNAFAFGRSKRDARICVTRALLNMLDEGELEAVLGHEISHIRHRDVAVITALSVIPMICYFIFQSFFFSGLFGGRDRNNAGLLAVAAVAFIVYFVSNLLVLYASRIREYYADEGSARLTGKPHELASALYKMIYGSVRVKREDLREIEGIRAFFATDPTRARRDIVDLMSADINRDGKIDPYELRRFSAEAGSVSTLERFMELFSTHPNPVNRIKRLGNL
ncbi:MAG TPA: peptidase [Candidatus Syntrophoarchaeum butanivorans]|uniref:Protease HtpX homolog n=1 Tax=Candidatus Syntropharchaeum butanivorans TaxID=1839936 RepID=A0A7C1BAY5_9EURY|nr:peptidase [Candidatus Syntrophoarchaeum butanivorans]